MQFMLGLTGGKPAAIPRKTCHTMAISTCQCIQVNAHKHIVTMLGQTGHPSRWTVPPQPAEADVHKQTFHAVDGITMVVPAAHGGTCEQSSYPRMHCALRMQVDCSPLHKRLLQTKHQGTRKGGLNTQQLSKDTLRTHMTVMQTYLRTCLVPLPSLVVLLSALLKAAGSLRLLC